MNTELRMEHARYNAGCRDQRARAGHAAYMRAVRSGATRLIADPMPAREHLEALLRSGWTWRALADRAGVDRSALYRQAVGERSRMQRHVADALLAIPAARRDRRVERTTALIEDTEFLLSMGEHAESVVRRTGAASAAALARLLLRHSRPDLAAPIEAFAQATKRVAA